MQSFSSTHAASAVAALLSIGLLAACGSSSLPSAQLSSVPVPPPAEIVPAKAFDLTVASPAADTLTGAATTAIAATVFVPKHAKAASYPLIVHSHGWGGKRVTESGANTNNQNADTSTLYSRVVDNEVKKFWDDGYAVISFDERGIGQSGGQVRVMDPNFETRDAMALIDWADKNLDLLRDAHGDPKIGTIGGSYGGGFQTLLAAKDPRVDAITPSVSWYNLNQALQPDHVLAKGWLAGLCLVAKTDQRKLDPTIQTTCEEAATNPATRFQEDLAASGTTTTRYFDEHSPSAFEKRHNDPASGYRMHPVDALVIQGMRDTLFTVNHAASNYRFLKSLGGDVRLLTHQHGHILPAPFSQNLKLGSIRCGNTDTIDAMHRWMDEKLKGQAGRTAGIPGVCISLDDNNGVNLPEVPVGGAMVVSIAQTTISGAQNNMMGGMAPAFFPLAAPINQAGMVLAGIPLGHITITSSVPGQHAVAFVAIGIQRGGTAPQVVDYQVRPLRDDYDHSRVELNGIGERLQAGDVVGVLVYGAWDEFGAEGQAGNWVSNRFSISGTVELPIQSVPIQTVTP